MIKKRAKKLNDKRVISPKEYPQKGTQLTPNCKTRKPSVTAGITIAHSTIKICIARTQIAKPKRTHPREINAQCIFVWRTSFQNEG
jgi:hypothetical protein